MESSKDYRDLVVWQESVDLVTEIYKITKQFPNEELYGLTSQMRRASISIPSNIAEGQKCGLPKDFRHFLIIPFSSGAELETQVEIAKRLPFGVELDYSVVDGLLDEVMKMLNTFIYKLKTND